MKKRHLITLLFLLAGLPLLQAQTALQERLDKFIETTLPEASEVGISVYDLTKKKQLYAYRENKLSRPASLMKLLTVITALSQPDASAPFVTDVWYKGTIEHDTLLGDLYVVGGFDPEFGDEQMGDLVEQVTTFPFTSIKGKIYGDLTMKDSLYWGNGWAWDDNPYSFQPYLSPLIYHKGMVTVTATPAAVSGDTASITCEPVSSFYTLRNETKTKTSSAGKFSVSRNWLENKNDIVVKGNVERKRTGEVNVFSSQDFFMHAFVERLYEKGITTEGEYGYSEFTKDSTAVHMAHTECPVQVAIDRIMKKSDNLSAEALLCKLAVQYTGRRKVSADDGLEAIKARITALGYNPADFRIADGSGLSNYNYVSPALLTDFLKFAYSHTDIFRQLYKSLPVSGIDGTLKYRMKKGSVAYRNVKAKTGSFTGISGLAGYLKNRKGHDIAFAIMNQNAMSMAKAREFQDKLCEILCEE